MRPWTEWQSRHSDPPVVASMGPRPCGRGRAVLAADALGMDMKLQWGHGLAAVDGAYVDGLQGTSAASMGPRPCGRGRTVDIAPEIMECAGLQWGHGLAAVDGMVKAHDWAKVRRLQWGHGLAAVDGRFGVSAASAESSFNGATALRPWTGRRVRR